MDSKKKKHQEIVDTSVKIDSNGMTDNEKVVALLYAGAVISGILAVYRIVVLGLIFGIASFAMYLSQISAIAIFATLSTLLWFYGKYRSHSQDLSNLQLIQEYSIMKALSFIAGLCSILRFVSTIVYFLDKESINTITALYVVIELVLWLVLAAFFFMFWDGRRKRAKLLKQDDFNERLKI